MVLVFGRELRSALFVLQHIVSEVIIAKRKYVLAYFREKVHCAHF